MSRENVELVRLIYGQWDEDGSFRSSDLFDPEIEWVNPADAVEPGTRRGLENFLGAAESVGDSFENIGMDFEQFIDAGDDVVVIATLKGKGRGSGAEVHRKQGYVWTIKDGKAVRFRWFSTPAEALEAVGLAATDP